MLVIPAIDLYNGNIVRMINGRKEQIITYGTGIDSVLKKIGEFLDAGIRLVHIIDLSRTIANSDENFDVLKKISENGFSQYVQIGGGIRSYEYSMELLELGFKRQIITSMVLKNPESVEKVIENGVEVVFSLDTDSSGTVKTHGWNEGEKCDLTSLFNTLKSIGIKEIIHTDTNADGTLSGRDLTFTEQLAERFDLEIIVAGGIGSIQDIENVKNLSERLANVKGVIVGRAYYEGRVSLKEMVNYAC
ncbi:HisA/HisF-related TIM barrel protein [Fervidobacterium pennivorans subsp. carthaginiensis]|uniref:HisA/HisF-related TIM barrel protein n=1 Tax=Fervidobacterium pennivorans TaxID=93466 RepID=UPI00355AFAF0